MDKWNFLADTFVFPTVLGLLKRFSPKAWLCRIAKDIEPATCNF